MIGCLNDRVNSIVFVLYPVLCRFDPVTVYYYMICPLANTRVIRLLNLIIGVILLWFIDIFLELVAHRRLRFAGHTRGSTKSAEFSRPLICNLLIPFFQTFSEQFVYTLPKKTLKFQGKAFCDFKTTFYANCIVSVGMIRVHFLYK